MLLLTLGMVREPGDGSEAHEQAANEAKKTIVTREIPKGIGMKAYGFQHGYNFNQ